MTTETVNAEIPRAYLDGDRFCIVCGPCATAAGDRAEPIDLREDLLSDSPQHCSECGVLLHYALTDQGLERLLEDVVSRASHAGAADSLLGFYQADLREYVQTRLRYLSGPVAHGALDALAARETERAKALLRLLAD